MNIGRWFLFVAAVVSDGPNQKFDSRIYQVFPVGAHAMIAVGIDMQLVFLVRFVEGFDHPISILDMHVIVPCAVGEE